MYVIILILVYKIKYFVELLIGLVMQMLQLKWVIVLDDSFGGEFGELLCLLVMVLVMCKLFIEIYWGLWVGVYENFKYFVQLWDGLIEFCYLMLDDDVFYFDFYMCYMMVYVIGCYLGSISVCWCVNECGQLVEGMFILKVVWFFNDCMLLLDLMVLFLMMLLDCQNWLGEFFNCVMCKEMVELLFNFEFGGVFYVGLWDLGVFLVVSLIGLVFYIQDCFGMFCVGGEGYLVQMMGKYMKVVYLGYGVMVLGVFCIGCFGVEQVCQVYVGLYVVLSFCYFQEVDVVFFIDVMWCMSEGDVLVEEDFLLLWSVFLVSYKF